MDLNYSAEELAFRDEARAWLAANLPRELKGKVEQNAHLSKEDLLRWHRILAKKGWVAPAWPKEWGGTGWNVVQRYIFEEELGYAGSPPIIPFGVTMCAAVLLQFGSDAQKKRFLPRIYNGDDFWCQGYSEPGSGSDLASLKTKAVRQGDHYVVNGQKIWTTLAHYADWIFCLVRTDAKTDKRQDGISFLLIDMKTPGITVRPIIMVDGAHHVNDVFFDNVRVPVENRIGKEGEGWTCAKFLLANERLGIAEVPASKRGVRTLRDIARSEPANGLTLADDPAFTNQIADLDLQVQALEMSELRALSAMAQGGAPGPEVSTLKIRGSEIQQRIAELTMEAVGEYAQPYQPGMLFHDTNETPVGPDHAPPAAPRYFNMRKTSIYGGSNEIQKNIVSKMVLGL
jgi:alkylation response protein AidB-like acyl-CoA dehydrogenase